MKTSKLVIGIISIVLFLFIAMQSCVAGLGNAMADNGEVSGTSGLILAIAMLVSGIVAIATRNNEKAGGSMVCAVFYILAGIIGLITSGSYTDLNIWAGLSILFGIIFVFFIFKQKKNGKSE